MRKRAISNLRLLMNPDEALGIIRSLADGVDPYSGERFASDSPYQQADTVRGEPGSALKNQESGR